MGLPQDVVMLVLNDNHKLIEGHCNSLSYISSSLNVCQTGHRQMDDYYLSIIIIVQ